MAEGESARSMERQAALAFSDKRDARLALAATVRVPYDAFGGVMFLSHGGCCIVRSSLGIVVAFTVSLVVSALLGPSPAAAHMNHIHHVEMDAANTHPAAPHHSTADTSQDDAKADGACCMLACTPAVLAVSSPAEVSLRVTGRVAPTLARITAARRIDPPFHPPRRA